MYVGNERITDITICFKERKKEQMNDIKSRFKNYIEVTNGMAGKTQLREGETSYIGGRRTNRTHSHYRAGDTDYQLNMTQMKKQDTFCNKKSASTIWLLSCTEHGKKKPTRLPK